ncbi:hypothetical protein [Anaerosinus sp.]|uniref:hypothetical protein n=1 Tax=Selenobaculum sp. TaxID=3074374 RepID=UPI003AB23751
MQDVDKAIKIACDADKRHELIDLYGRDDLNEVMLSVATVLNNKKSAPAPTGTDLSSQL